MESRIAEFKRSAVRIGTKDGEPVGAGFLVSKDGHVLTCAHVVAGALGTGDEMAEKPQDSICLDFPFLGAAVRMAYVEHWQPLAGPSTNQTGDIAALKLSTSSLPTGAQPARLTTLKDFFGHGFSVYGYPEGYDTGVWAYGLLRDHLGNGWLQVEDTKGTGARIEYGFSGGPVRDQETGRIVGMVVAASRDRTDKVGFVIPADVLARACPDFVSMVGAPRETAVEADPEPSPLGRFTVRPEIVTNASRARCLLTSPNNGEVQSVAFSSASRLLVASGGADKTVRLWRLDSETLIREIDHRQGLRSIMSNVGGKTNSIASRDDVVRASFSPDGRLAASGGADKAARLWQVNGGALVREMGHKGTLAYVNCLAFSPDGQLLAAGLQNGAVYLWRVQDGALVRKMRHGRLLTHVCSVAFSSDGRLLVTGANDGTVGLWRWRNGQLVRKMRHGGWSILVQCVAFSSDGQLVASGGTDGNVRLWWVDNGILMCVLEGHEEWVTGVAITQDRRMLVSSSSDATIRLWRVDDGMPLGVLEGHTDWVNSVAVSRDGRLVASGSKDGTVKLWGVA